MTAMPSYPLLFLSLVLSNTASRGLHCPHARISESRDFVTTMKKRYSSQSAFFNLRVLIGLFIVLAGVFLALAGLGAFSALAAEHRTSAAEE